MYFYLHVVLCINICALSTNFERCFRCLVEAATTSNSGALRMKGPPAKGLLDMPKNRVRAASAHRDGDSDSDSDWLPAKLPRSTSGKGICFTD